jgi:hypothetical protein
MRFKRNQLDEAIIRTLGADGTRVEQLKIRLKRLLVADRRQIRGQHSTGRCYAFYSEEPPGSGVEIMFSGYEAFALLAAVLLLEHGLPQAKVVRILQQIRMDLEAAHRESLKKDPRVLFDPKLVQAMAKPGMIPTDNTDPVFLAFVKLSVSAIRGGEVRALVSVCRGQKELAAFIKKHSVPGLGATFFEFVSLMHKLADNLSRTRAVKRGRSTI